MLNAECRNQRGLDIPAFPHVDIIEDYGLQATGYLSGSLQPSAYSLPVMVGGRLVGRRLEGSRGFACVVRDDGVGAGAANGHE